MEFGHAEVAESGGEGVDGGERCSGGSRKDESMRDEDVEYVFISIGIHNRELVICAVEYIRHGPHVHSNNDTIPGK